MLYLPEVSLCDSVLTQIGLSLIYKIFLQIYNLKAPYIQFRCRIFVLEVAIQKFKVKISRTIILPLLYGCLTWSLTL